jgi:probable selenium-dependent hydroxylase accessory protein YqeC
MMKLIDAIRLDEYSTIAFVGAGGKTTAMFQLARQSDKPVLVTTTTHLAVEQAGRADMHYALEEGEGLPDLSAAIKKHRVILVTGLAHADGRLGSPPASVLEDLKEFADERGYPLLIEADGSRKLPIKSPAENEPVIPVWVDAVAIVVGLSCLGRPASQEVIHRFSQFSAVAGILEGEIIDLIHLEKMLLHPVEDRR